MSVLDMIAAGPRPPQIQDPVEAQARLVGLRNAQMQGPLLEEQLRGSQMENQQRQIQMDQMKAINDAYRGAFTPGADGSVDLDTNKLSTALATSGHGSAIPSILEGVTKFKQSQATLRESEQKIAAAAADAAGSLGAAVKQANNDPHLFVTLAQHAVQTHSIDPKVAASFLDPVQQALQQDPTGESARQIVGQISDNLIAQSAKQQELINQRNTAQGGLLRGQAAQSQAERANAAQDLKTAAADLATASSPAEYASKLDALPHGLATKFPAVGQVFDQSGQPIDEGVQRVRFIGMTPAEQQAAVKPQRESNPTEASLAMVATDPNRTPEERAAANAALKRLDQSKIAARPVNVTNVGVPGFKPSENQQLHGDEYIATLPSAMQGTVRAVRDGRQTIPSGIAQSKPYWQEIMAAVHQADPGWSEQRAQVRRDFTTKGDGRNIGNLNTAVVHLDQLAEIANAMDNGTFQPGNEIFNRARTMFGGAAPTNYEGLRQAVAGEMDAALHGTSTIPGRDAIAATMPAKASPGQMAGIVKTNLATLATKLNTYDERYHAQNPDDKAWSPVLPSARAVLQKHGITGGELGGQGGAGKTYQKTAVGPNGHKIGWNPGDATWTDIQTGKPVK